MHFTLDLVFIKNNKNYMLSLLQWMVKIIKIENNINVFQNKICSILISVLEIPRDV